MATRKTATKAAAKPVVEKKRYVVLNGCFDQCYCSAIFDNIKAASDDAVKHYNDGDGDDDVIYVVEIVKTVTRGKAAIHEGYFNEDEEDEKNAMAII